MRYLESSFSPTTVCNNHSALARDRTTGQSKILQTADSASVLGVQAAENWPGWSQDIYNLALARSNQLVSVGGGQNHPFDA